MSSMSPPDELSAILDRIIANNHYTEADHDRLRQLTDGGRQLVSQSGKYAVNLGQGTDIHIGDRIYQGASAEVIREIIQELQSIKPADAPKLRSVEELVRQVRSHVHDDIQRLHGTMPLWGMSEPVPLSDLFVDVNLLAEPNSDRRDELDNLWQDFQQGLEHYSSHRSLDRIGLGREQIGRASCRERVLMPV